MDCLKTLIGLQGGCADISADASLYLNSKITYSELSDYIDQNDYANVDSMFTSIRSNAVDLFLAEYQTEMRNKYVSKTVINQQTFGNYDNGLKSSAATAKLKGILFDRCTNYPQLGYRVTNVGFIGDHTGNITVLYYDGLTGKQLASDTIAAIAGELVKLNVNRLFNVTDLIIAYDATAIDAYQTKIDCYVTGCRSCSKWKVNAHCEAKPITATIGSPFSYTATNEMGGLVVDVSMECDNESWLCGIKQQLAMPIMFKIAELVMEYAITSSSRGNTRTMRDRKSLIKSEYEKHLKLALSRAAVPNDPICFHCRKTNGVYVAIP